MNNIMETLALINQNDMLTIEQIHRVNKKFFDQANIIFKLAYEIIPLGRKIEENELSEGVQNTLITLYVQSLVSNLDSIIRR